MLKGYSYYPSSSGLGFVHHLLHFSILIDRSIHPAEGMAMRRVYNEIKGKKVSELPAYIKPKLSVDYVKKSVEKAFDNYHAKYIETSSLDPLLHVCFGGMIFSYLVALPEERRHLEHQQHAKGGH